MLKILITLCIAMPIMGALQFYLSWQGEDSVNDHLREAMDDLKNAKLQSFSAEATPLLESAENHLQNAQLAIENRSSATYFEIGILRAHVQTCMGKRPKAEEILRELNQIAVENNCSGDTVNSIIEHHAFAVYHVAWELRDEGDIPLHWKKNISQAINDYRRLVERNRKDGDTKSFKVNQENLERALAFHDLREDRFRGIPFPNDTKKSKDCKSQYRRQRERAALRNAQKGKPKNQKKIKKVKGD